MFGRHFQPFPCVKHSHLGPLDFLSSELSPMKGCEKKIPFQGSKTPSPLAAKIKERSAKADRLDKIIEEKERK